jgi:hypothetical protein
MAWSDAQDHALRVAINRCNPTRPLGPNAQEPLRKKWEEVARSEGVPAGCTAQAAFERAVELGWSSYPPQHKAKVPHLGPSVGGQRALGSLPAALPGAGASAAAARSAPHKPQHRSHPAAYHLPRAAAGSGSSGGGSGGGSGGSGSGSAAAAKAAPAPTAGLKRREPPLTQPSERREPPQTLPSERGSSSSSSSSSGGGGGGSSGGSSSRPARYKPGAAEAMQHLCDGLKADKYDEAAFASMYSAALDHFAPLAAR